MNPFNLHGKLKSPRFEDAMAVTKSSPRGGALEPQADLVPPWSQNGTFSESEKHKMVNQDFEDRIKASVNWETRTGDDYDASTMQV